MAIAFISNAQTKFEKGYFVDNQGIKTECFIKNEDWKNNPTVFKFKLSESETDEHSNSISTIKEFAISDRAKFTRETVAIDQSSQNMYGLTSYAEPMFKDETVFLKVFVEGNSNLYYYESENTNKFFYTVNNKIDQLIFKKYSDREGSIVKNEGYKRQLYTNFKCSDADRTKIEKLKYEEDDLTAYFTQINNCKSGTAVTNVVSKREKFDYHLKLNVLLSNTGGAFNMTYGNIRGNYDLDSKSAVSFGFEAEVVMPFNNKTWSVFSDPSYISRKDVIHIYKPMFANPNYTITSDVFIVRIPLGIRRYFPINQNNKIFADAALNVNLSKAKINFDNDRPSVDATYASTNASIGLGYQFTRFTAEVKYFLKTDVIDHAVSEDFYLKQVSLKLGYQLL
jgi:hypothetical protein